MKKLHPNAVTAFYLSGLVLMGLLIGLLIIFPLAMVMVATIAAGEPAGIAIAPLITIGVLVILIIPYPWARLAYNNFSYQLESDRITIERGVIWKKHASIPYERVQNVDIIRGPVARILGISDILIQTAGAHFTGQYGALGLAEGRIPAVAPDEAKRIKDEVLSKIGKKTSGGV